MQEQKEVSRAQKLQACEVALTGIAQNNEAVLRWFIAEVLHLSWPWRNVVTMALLDKDKAGVYRWRTAKNPLGIVRTIARRSALKWNPELLFGKDAEKVLRPQERAVSSFHDGLQSHASTDANDEDTGGGKWHDEFIERGIYKAQEKYGDDDEPPIWDELHSSSFASQQNGLSFDWAKIGQRLGLEPDQVILLQARARGITRAAMGAYLQWDVQKVERIWKAVARYCEQPETAGKARTVLLGW